MGLLDLFSKDGREARSRQSAIKRAVDKYAQSMDRMKALETLRDDPSGEAVYGLLRRFGMMYDKTIEDEQEKEWVFDILVSRGEAILPEVKKYLLAAESITWPLRVLDKIVPGRAAEVDVLAEVMARHEPGYERDPTKKIQLMNHLGALKEPRASALVAPYLGDMDEGVRYAAAEALIRLKEESSARDPLLEVFASDKEDSLRLRLRIAEGLVELGWKVPDVRRDAVIAKLPDAFSLAKDGTVRKK